MIGVAGELDYFSAYIRLREPDKSKDKAEEVNVATKEAKENKIGASPTTRWRRPCMRVAVYLSIDQGKLLREHMGVEASGRKGGGTSVESSIPCSHGGRALVMKGAEEVENAEANSKY
ncbi:hypothetical protein BHE74_00038576 [Ensete ventricosum]|nr:hypothetical protein BHE74_00038576 [Ensete ventricosum]